MDRNKVVELINARYRGENNMTWNEIADACGSTHGSVRGMARRIHRTEPQAVLNLEHTRPVQPLTPLDMLKRGTTIQALASSLGLTEKGAHALVDDLRNQGHVIANEGERLFISNIVPQTEPVIKVTPWNGKATTIRFGLMGDNQFGSIYTQKTALQRFYDLLQSEGIKDVYHTGDITEGYNMRLGHLFECYAHGADALVDDVVKDYPKHDGITTHFITGNHDHSIIKHSGYDIGMSISQQRDDLDYLGQSVAIIQLAPMCTLELRHPIDGTAYALSYKIQKMIEAMSGGEKPSILAVGHYHKAEYLFYRNVHAIQTGCFQAQSAWMRGKGLSAALGGWIIDIDVDADGVITRFRPEFVPVYTAIKNDY